MAISRYDFSLPQKPPKLQGMATITVFKLGEHLPNYTEADMAATVAAYDPAIHEAPIVIGHPRTDAPAFGWINALSQSGKTLLGKPKQVSADFSEWVRQGFWKKRSASFYPPGHADHPLGQDSNVYYLKHLGFLGAVPPKVKGMPDFEFCEAADESLFTLDFSEDSDDFGEVPARINAALWRSLRDWVIDTEGLETADRILSIWQIEALEAEANKPGWGARQDHLYQYGETTVPTEEELNDREKAIALRERQATLKEQELQFSEELDDLVKQGRVLAAEKASHLKRLKMLAAIPSDNIADFAEGKSDYSPTAEYLEELKGRSVVVNFSEISGGDSPEQTTDPAVIAAGIHAEIRAAKEVGQDISFAEASSRFTAKQGGNK